MQESKVMFVTKGVLANICASGCANEILAVQPYCCAILDDTTFPVLWDTSPEGETKIESQKIGLALIKEGILHPYPFQREQYCSMNVLLGGHLREELAALFTLASVHHAAVALDDPVIRKRVIKLLPSVSLQSTLAIFYHWHMATGLSNSETLPVLQRITKLAHFLPPHDDPLLPWWRQIFPNK